MNGYKHQIKTCVWTRTLQVYWAASGRSSGFRRMATDKKQPKKRSNILLRCYIYIYTLFLWVGGFLIILIDLLFLDILASLIWVNSRCSQPPRTHFQRAPGHDLAGTCPQRPQPTAQGKLRFERAGPSSGHGHGLWSTILIFLDAKKYWKPWNTHQSYVSGLKDGFLWIFT